MTSDRVETKAVVQHCPGIAGGELVSAGSSSPLRVRALSQATEAQYRHGVGVGCRDRLQQCRSALVIAGTKQRFRVPHGVFVR